MFCLSCFCLYYFFEFYAPAPRFLFLFLCLVRFIRGYPDPDGDIRVWDFLEWYWRSVCLSTHALLFLFVVSYLFVRSFVRSNHSFRSSSPLVRCPVTVTRSRSSYYVFGRMIEVRTFLPSFLHRRPSSRAFSIALLNLSKFSRIDQNNNIITITNNKVESTSFLTKEEKKIPPLDDSYRLTRKKKKQLFFPSFFPTRPT